MPHTRAQEGRRWLVEPYDVVASALLAGEGELTFPRWARSLRQVDETAWWAGDDRRPFFAMGASLGPLGLRYRARRRHHADSREAFAAPPRRTNQTNQTIDYV